MGLLMDGVGNVLSEGQLVRVDLQGGGSIIGRVAKIEQGGYHAIALASPASNEKMQPAVVIVETQVPTFAKPGSMVGGILVIKEPVQPKPDVQ